MNTPSGSSPFELLPAEIERIEELANEVVRSNPNGVFGRNYDVALATMFEQMDEQDVLKLCAAARELSATQDRLRRAEADATRLEPHTAFVDADKWRDSVREAIDAALHATQTPPTDGECA